MNTDIVLPLEFHGAAVVELVDGTGLEPDSLVVELQSAVVTVTPSRIDATVDGGVAWSWVVADIRRVVHGADEPWTIIEVPGIAEFGLAVRPEDVTAFRTALVAFEHIAVDVQRSPSAAPAAPAAPEVAVLAPAPIAAPALPVLPPWEPLAAAAPPPEPAPVPVIVHEPPVAAPSDPHGEASADLTDRVPTTGTAAALDARDVSAWFGDHMVLDRVSLHMPGGKVTSLIGPSGCGKSTFLRILNRMHEMIPSATLAGEVRLDGHDIYDPRRKLTDARREIGMVFQKPNPFPAMSIYDNVVASLRLTGTKASPSEKDALVERCLQKAGLWNEVKDRLRRPGGGLSGGQQQRLCIARALAITPRVLLMDEPCSALDPTSTRRIEETIIELAREVTIVIVTHNMQQAARVSDHCAFFLAAQGTPGVIVEHGPTDAMFASPQDSRTLDYVTGRFG